MCQSQIPNSSNNDSISNDLEKLSVSDKTEEVTTDNVSNTKDSTNEDLSSLKKDERTGEAVEEKNDP